MVPIPHSCAASVDEVVRRQAEAIVVDYLEEALVASRLGVRHRAVDEVSLVVAGLYHGPDESDAAVPLVLEYGVLGLGHEGFVVRLALARAVGSAPRRDGDGAGEGDAGRPHREQREACSQGQYVSCFHWLPPVRVLDWPCGWPILVAGHRNGSLDFKLSPLPADIPDAMKNHGWPNRFVPTLLRARGRDLKLPQSIVSGFR